MTRPHSHSSSLTEPFAERIIGAACPARAGRSAGGRAPPGALPHGGRGLHVHPSSSASSPSASLFGRTHCGLRDGDRDGKGGPVDLQRDPALVSQLGVGVDRLQWESCQRVPVALRHSVERCFRHGVPSGHDRRLGSASHRDVGIARARRRDVCTRTRIGGAELTRRGVFECTFPDNPDGHCRGEVKRSARLVRRAPLSAARRPIPPARVPRTKDCPCSFLRDERFSSLRSPCWRAAAP
jgi:hypothetical protein